MSRKQQQFRMEIVFGPELIDAMDDAMQRAAAKIINGLRHTQPPAAVEPPMQQAPAPAAAARAMLRREQLLQMVPFGRSTLQRMMITKKFPKPHYVSATNRYGTPTKLPHGRKPSG